MDVLAFSAIVVVGFTACAEFGSWAFVHPVLWRLPKHVRRSGASGAGPAPGGLPRIQSGAEPPATRGRRRRSSWRSRLRPAFFSPPFTALDPHVPQGGRLDDPGALGQRLQEGAAI